jgi:hypothetical protein
MLRSACTVQRCLTAAGHSARVAFQIPGAPSAMINAGAAHPARLQVAAEVQPGLLALTAAELQPEQHLLAFERQPPGNQDALGRLNGGAQLQVDRVQVSRRHAQSLTTTSSARHPEGDHDIRRLLVARSAVSAAPRFRLGGGQAARLAKPDERAVIAG